MKRKHNNSNRDILASDKFSGGYNKQRFKTMSHLNTDYFLHSSIAV